MRCAVSGSHGFVGRHLCRELARRGHDVTRLERSFFHSDPFEVIFHLAAWTEAGDFCLEHPGDQWLVNQAINTRMLQNWHDLWPTAKLVAIGSSCSYAPGPDLREADYMAAEPHASLYAYAMTKRMLYEGCRALHKQYGMRYLYAVPSAIYGPDYHTDGRKAHFIFDIVRKIIRGKELGEDVILWGDGLQWREVIYIADFIDILLYLAESRHNDIFNAASGDARTIRDFASILCRLIGYDESRIVYDRSKYVGSKVKYLNVDKMRAALPPDSALTDIEVGARKMVDWYLESGAWK